MFEICLSQPVQQKRPTGCRFAWVETLKSKIMEFEFLKALQFNPKRLILSSSKKKRQKIAEIPPFAPRPSPVEKKWGYLNFLRLQISYYAFRNFWESIPICDGSQNQQTKNPW